MHTLLILTVAAVVGLFALLLVLGVLAAAVNAFFGPSRRELAEAEDLLEEIAAGRAAAH